jgi:hypothetical protein
MPLNVLKKGLETIAAGVGKALEAFAVLVLAILVLVIARFGIDVAFYIFSKGVDALELVLGL